MGQTGGLALKTRQLVEKALNPPDNGGIPFILHGWEFQNGSLPRFATFGRTGVFQALQLNLIHAKMPQIVGVLVAYITAMRDTYEHEIALLGARMALLEDAASRKAKGSEGGAPTKEEREARKAAEDAVRNAMKGRGNGADPVLDPSLWALMAPRDKKEPVAVPVQEQAPG